MSNRSETSPCASAGRRLLRASLTAALLTAAALLAGCASPRPDQQTTSAIPDDYRTRHPITVAEVEHKLDVPVGAGEHGLTTATRDLIKGFAQDYVALSKSTLQVALPVDAANSAAAAASREQVRRTLVAAGIPANRIVLTRYNANARDASAPVRLSFVAVTAITDECGQWPTDVGGPTVANNTNYENFGCASQQNLAAQIANPADLVGPRGMTPIDAANRAAVIQTYRDGASSDTSSSE